MAFAGRVLPLISGIDQFDAVELLRAMSGYVLLSNASAVVAQARLLRISRVPRAHTRHRRLEQVVQENFDTLQNLVMPLDLTKSATGILPTTLGGTGANLSVSQVGTVPVSIGSAPNVFALQKTISANLTDAFGNIYTFLNGLLVSVAVPPSGSMDYWGFDYFGNDYFGFDYF